MLQKVELSLYALLDLLHRRNYSLHLGGTVAQTLYSYAAISNPQFSLNKIRLDCVTVCVCEGFRKFIVTVGQEGM